MNEVLPVAVDWKAAAYQYTPLPPESVMLKEILSAADLQGLFESYYTLTKIPVAIIDFEGNVLCSSRWQRICVEFHRANPATCQRCLESDKYLATQLEAGQIFTMYPCKNHMTDCAAPIVIDGKRVANVFVGQFLTAPPDEALFRKQAQEFGFNVDEYLKALRDVPVVDTDKIAAVLDLLRRMTNVVTKLAIDRKKALSGEEQLKKAMTTSADAFYVATLRDGKLIEANESFKEVFGYVPTEVIGKTSIELGLYAEPADRQRWIAELLKTGHVRDVQLQCRKKGGEIITVLLSASRLSGGQEPLILGVVKDISALMRAQRSLVASEQKYRELVENANSIILRWGPDGRISFLNEFGLKFFGYREDEVIGHNLVGTIFPQSEDTQRDLMRLVENIGADPHRFEQNINENIKRNGDRVWVSWTNKLVLNEQGQIKELLSIGSDITERRKAEEAVRASHDLLRSVIDNAPIRVFWKDRALRYSGCNALFARDAGMPTPADVVGKDDFQLTWPDQADLYRQDDEQVMQANAPKLNYEEPQTNKAGHMLWLRTSKVPLHDAAGNVSGILGIYDDITERKLASDRLRRSLEGTIGAMAATVESRDPYTAGHQRRVAQLAAAIATALHCSAQTIEGIRFGALIHDLGKIQVPAEILAKPTKLNKYEFELIKAHPEVGYDIVKAIDFPWPVANMIRQHHERLDGSGYPQGLKGNDICLEARILTVADVVEAMASHRPYRPALGVDVALTEIEKHKGTWYEADVVTACVHLFREQSFAFATS